MLAAVLSEEQRALADGGSWVEAHEEAAHQKRNWVRLTFDCNDHCIFCLDSQAHDGRVRDRGEVKAQILDGRRKGAERLILSGGEPTIHPDYVDFIRLGRMAGYERIQTVTNGRMFRYPEFLKRCLDAGLGEITFSLHGPNAKVHDALVGVKGAFDQEVEGLRLALEDGRPIVNIDICVNRGNVKLLPEMLERFTEMGVREYDLLHVIPFGNAWRDGREVLFYDLDEMMPYLHEAFAWSKKPDMHIWLNRFPVKHCEGFHELIQDPYKLNDEIRGRREEYERWIDYGEPLDCREERRCGHCYLQDVCDTFEQKLEQLREPECDIFRVDNTCLTEDAPSYGGDPASRGKVRLPLAQRRAFHSLDELAKRSGATRLRVVAPNAPEALRLAARFTEPNELELELDDYSGLDLNAFARPIARCFVMGVEDAEVLLEQSEVEVVLAATRESLAWLNALTEPPPHLSLRQLTWERLTESRDSDLTREEIESVGLPIEGLPACLQPGHSPPSVPVILDAAMCDPSGRLAPFRFVGGYIRHHYFSKSVRCVECRHEAGCRGLHVNHIRAWGFESMRPIAE